MKGRPAGSRASMVESREVVGHIQRRTRSSTWTGGTGKMVTVQVAVWRLRLSCGCVVRRVAGRDVTDDPRMVVRWPLQANGRRYSYPPRYVYCELCQGNGVGRFRPTSPRRARGLWSPGVGEAAVALLEARGVAREGAACL